MQPRLRLLAELPQPRRAERPPVSALHPPSGPHRSCSGGVRPLASLRHPVLLALCTGRVWGTCVSEPLSSIRVHMGVYVTRLASSWLRRGSEAERTRPSWSEEPKAAHRPGPERPRLQLPRLLGGSVSSTRPCCRLRLPWGKTSPVAQGPQFGCGWPWPLARLGSFPPCPLAAEPGPGFWSEP